ncbi:7597_t:CDS:1, partial [Gigaspora rosea]
QTQPKTPNINKTNKGNGNPLLIKATSMELIRATPTMKSTTHDTNDEIRNPPMMESTPTTQPTKFATHQQQNLLS